MSNDVKFHPEDSAPRRQLLPHLYLFKVVSRTSHVQRDQEGGTGRKGREAGPAAVGRPRHGSVSELLCA